MALRSDWSGEACPIRRAVDVVGDPWVLLIVGEVLHGNGRFEQLRGTLGISEAVLSRRLKMMVETGLLTKVDYDDAGRVRQGYAATEAASDLLPIVQQLALWGEKHTGAPTGGTPIVMVHRSCGQETTRAEVCSACGETLVAEQMRWINPSDNTGRDLVGPGVLV
ncbi:helix-turn-helix transcriptional regulator [Leucobacter sp. UCMA 4100]|uniref:winged helix-turn-helix transcriptional regulator n=1 Tax=Leucobacter sp. UCMA 4100 TaxID=2810534 RepID=UPI0022EB72CE|nr:helix-turn-helix domain-containing protein [Leucobacter sp. UCMA 4100]MDA3147704.1 helix-turn-helix transcriptional regulator [Leucobacter sp. UCMA 4100]